MLPYVLIKNGRAGQQAIRRRAHRWRSPHGSFARRISFIRVELLPSSSCVRAMHSLPVQFVRAALRARSVSTVRNVRSAAPLRLQCTDASKTASATTVKKAAQTPTSNVVSQEEKKVIPEVNSTTLGLEDPQANDPLKWRKFAWKYAGALALFLVAYKSLHWYVDALEADGKRRKEEMEENKVIASEFQEDQARAQTLLNAAQNPAQSIVTEDNAQNKQPAMLFKPVQEEEGFVSELDELRTLQVELEAKLKALNAERRQTDEIEQKKWDIHGELKDLAKEIAELEKTERRKSQ